MTSLNLPGSPMGRPKPRPWDQVPGPAGCPPAGSSASRALGWAFGILAVLGTAARPAAAAAPASAPAPPPPVLPLTARLCLVREPSAANPSPVCIDLEEPRTPQQHAWGLMMRPPLPPRRGMWFAFLPAQPARFWMHRTPNPLDLVYIRNNQVLKIDRALPACMRLPCPVYGTEVPVDGVLEIGAGQAASLGITVGAAVRIEPLSASVRKPPARD
ncbi:MAG: DUF192 domain-containing protein [Synechococcaceae cyanobacterium]